VKFNTHPQLQVSPGAAGDALRQAAGVDADHLHGTGVLNGWQPDCYVVKTA